MFRSLKEGIRSFWSPPADEIEVERVPTGSKRKNNSPDRANENGKRRKLDNHSSTSTISDYIRHSVTKMANWLRPKPKSFSEDFTGRPYIRADHSGRVLLTQENGNHRNTNHVPRRNVEGNQNREINFSKSSSQFSETPLNSSQVHKGKSIDGSRFSRRPSESSMLGHRKQSIANESMRLHEREQYRQLLQLQSQRSPWQVKIPMSTPDETSSFPSSSGIPYKYSGLPDSSNGHLLSHLDVAEAQKRSAMSSLLSKRSRPWLSTPALSTSSPRPATVSHVKPQFVPQQHLRTTQASNSSPSKTPWYRGESTSKRSLVKRDKERNRDLEDVVSNHGDTYKIANKMNGDIHWSDAYKPLEESETIVIEDDEDQTAEQRVPPLKPSHTGSQDCFIQESSKFQASYKRCQAYLQEKERRKTEIEEEEMKARAYEEKRRLQTLHLEKQMKYQMKIFDELPELVEDIFIEEEEEEEQLPELTEDMVNIIRAALRPGNPNEVLSDAFRLQLTRRDMSTLAGLNWLNDEVINFYMNMLTERGEKEGHAKVYAFNTFFYPKIMSGGHGAVKRWTKKVDIFSVHFILIPVHLGVHWCLCVVDMQEKNITYYDSMGATNNQCLQAVLNYINDESVAKKQTPIKKSEWTLVNADDNPQQMNGSDCGMFMCKYAEYITRQKDITFSQEDMPYFRQRMVYEIISKKLLQ